MRDWIIMMIDGDTSISTGIHHRTDKSASLVGTVTGTNEPDSYRKSRAIRTL